MGGALLHHITTLILPFEMMFTAMLLNLQSYTFQNTILPYCTIDWPLVTAVVSLPIRSLQPPLPLDLLVGRPRPVRSGIM
jgi:hypothetical protein